MMGCNDCRRTAARIQPAAADDPSGVIHSASSMPVLAASVSPGCPCPKASHSPGGAPTGPTVGSVAGMQGRRSIRFMQVARASDANASTVDAAGCSARIAGSRASPPISAARRTWFPIAMVSAMGSSNRSTVHGHTEDVPAGTPRRAAVGPQCRHHVAAASDRRRSRGLDYAPALGRQRTSCDIFSVRSVRSAWLRTA